MDTISEAEGFTSSVASVLFSAPPISNECYCRSHRKSNIRPVHISPSERGYKVSNQHGRHLHRVPALNRSSAEDCEIAVCQGKTRGQLWAPVAEWAGPDSWKEATAKVLSGGFRGKLLPL